MASWTHWPENLERAKGRQEGATPRRASEQKSHFLRSDPRVAHRTWAREVYDKDRAKGRQEGATPLSSPSGRRGEKIYFRTPTGLHLEDIRNAADARRSSAREPYFSRSYPPISMTTGWEGSFKGINFSPWQDLMLMLSTCFVGNSHCPRIRSFATGALGILRRGVCRSHFINHFPAPLLVFMPRINCCLRAALKRSFYERICGQSPHL